MSGIHRPPIGEMHRRCQQYVIYKLKLIQPFVKNGILSCTALQIVKWIVFEVSIQGTTDMFCDTRTVGGEKQHAKGTSTYSCMVVIASPGGLKLTFGECMTIWCFRFAEVLTQNRPGKVRSNSNTGLQVRDVPELEPHLFVRK